MRDLSNLTILWIDDQKEILKVVEMVFENRIKNIYTSSNPLEGLALYKKYIPDIVLLDVNMPQLDGITLAKMILEINPLAQIIFVTASNDSEYIKKTNELGLHQYILKPIDKDLLFAELYKAQTILEEERNSCSLDSSKSMSSENISYTDYLTKLYNRNGLMRNIVQTNPIGIMIIDIKNFSKINALYGIKVGDSVLQSFATVLLKIADNHCLVHRLGGDQFVFLNTQQRSLEFCIEKVNTIIHFVDSTPIIINYQNEPIEVNLNVNIGIARDLKKEDLLECANMALGYTKTHNEPFTVYSKELQIEAKYKKELEAVKMLKTAIDEDRVIPYFQPIEKKDYTYYEALVRIQMNDGNVISPFEFLEASKGTIYYNKLTKIMIEKSFKIFRNNDKILSLNFSYEDIENEEIINFLTTMMTQYNMENRVIVEIVEDETIKDEKMLERFTKALLQHGAKVAIDDFGSGYSNFSRILEVDPSFIKIDGSLIKNIDTNSKHLSIVKAIIGFAKEFHLEVVAEYVENEEIYNILKELGVDGLQGYYIGKPDISLKD